MGDITERMRYWLQRVNEAKKRGDSQLSVTPEEYRDLKRLQSDYERDYELRRVSHQSTTHPSSPVGFPVVVVRDET